MQKQFADEAMDFNDNDAVDFEKSFDLTGSNNDEMLRVYLRKAGISDDIEELSSKQKKALIYDIIRSNKNPGYWKPNDTLTMPPQSILRNASPPVEPSTSVSIPSIDDIPQASMNFYDFKDYSHVNKTYSTLNGTYKSTPIEEQEIVRRTLYERQFQQQKSISPKIYNTPPTPPSPSTLITRKGLKIEISGPTNFQHISGDMGRDKTRNAFDLSGQFNNNSLKKYMIERGITDEDVSGMDSKELIRRIVQSKFTWMPIRNRYTSHQIPPPPSKTFRTPSRSPPPRNKHHSKGGALVVAPPRLPPADTSSSENIYMEIMPPEQCAMPIMRRPVKPPPMPIVKKPTTPKPTVNISGGPPPPPPPPPPMPSLNTSVALVANDFSKANVPTKPVDSGGDNRGAFVDSIPMPIAKKPTPPVHTVNMSGGPPPPPPPPMPSLNTSVAPVAIDFSTADVPTKPVESGGDNRGALLDSIRTGVALKKVNKANDVKPNLGPMKTHNTNPSEQSTPPGTIRQKPATSEKPDFMSELRNATLKRIKKLENNPYAIETSESQC